MPLKNYLRVLYSVCFVVFQSLFCLCLLEEADSCCLWLGLQRQHILLGYFSGFYAEMNRLFEVERVLVVPVGRKGSEIHLCQTVNTVRQCTEGNFDLLITVFVQKVCQC